MRHQSQASCTNRAPREFPHHELQEEALIKVSVMYPNKPGVRFDHELPNFTDGTSIHQISEVVVENSAKVETAALHRIPIDRGSSPHKSHEVIP